MLATILSAAFVIAVAFAYYKDYKNHILIWGKKTSKLYLFVIGTIIIVILKKIFF
jgi:hypothetical protein